jgi:hypothetical protein
MEVVKIKKQKDGSALVTIDYDKNEEKMLVEYALRDIIKKGVKKLKREKT